jgi:hypothetical protein
MAESYLQILLIILLALLGWGIVRTERIYQFPFFMASIFISFILPQAFSLVDNPSLASPEALDRVLLMSCLCITACWLGYQTPTNKKWLNQLDISLDENRLFQAGLVLMVIAYFFNFLLSRTQIEIAENFNWTGKATIYFFFQKVIYIAFAIFMLHCLKHRRIQYFICAAIASWIPIRSIILAGRRQVTMTFIIIIGFSLWMVFRYVPPRWLIIFALLLLIVIIPLLGALRGRFWELLFAGQWDNLFAKAQTSLAIKQQGEILELRNAALFMDATEKTGLYGLGSGFWDSIIFQFVPGQIVGFGVKQSLQFNLITDATLYNLYGYIRHTGTTITGLGDSFMEFGYLGCLCFALQGVLFKHLWVSVVAYRSTASALFYMVLISPAMVGVTHGIGRFLQEAIFQFIFLGLAVYYSQVKPQDKNILP